MSDGRHITELLARVEALEEGDGGGGSITATVVLTNAQILTLVTVPVPLVAAPGTDRLLTVASVAVGPLSGPGGYTNIDPGGSGFQIQFGPAGGVEYPCQSHAEMDDIQSGNVVTLGSKAQYSGSQVSPSAAVVNVPLYVGFDNAAAGNLTGGNVANALPVTVYYSVADVSA